MSDLECPYCKHEFEDDGGEINYAAATAPDSKTAVDCPKCEREMAVFVEWDPVFYTFEAT